MLQENGLQTLVDLGLSDRQARVFLVLAKSGVATARDIAKGSRMARQDVYKVVDELKETGLVETQIGTPTKFIAIPIQDACNILVDRIVQKTSELKQRSEALVKHYQTPESEKSNIGDQKLLIFPQGEAFVNLIRKTEHIVQESIDLVIPIKPFMQGLSLLSNSLKETIARKVKVRIITDESKDISSLLSAYNFPLKDPNFAIRTSPIPLQARFSVCDSKEINTVFFSDSDFGKSELLWSNYQDIVRVYQAYFNLLWQNCIDWTPQN